MTSCLSTTNQAKVMQLECVFKVTRQEAADSI